MKKLCAITTVDSTMSHFVVDAMRELVREGYDVTLVCSMSEKFSQQYSGEFHCVHWPMARGISFRDLFRSVAFFYRFFRREKFEYVQYATPNASLYASVAAWLAHIPKRVYCQWGIRYVGASGKMRFLLKYLEKLVCRISTHVRAASRKNLDYAVKEGLYRREKAKIIGDGGTVGVDFSLFDINRKQEFREAVLLEYPELQNKIVFCFVGRIQKDKGFNELWIAFKTLSQKNGNAALLVVGDWDGDSGEGISDCRKVVFTGYTDEVYKYMSVADVLVHPSYREGFSMVIQQGMAMGLPVITTDIPGPSEVIEDGISGVLVPPKNVIRLLDAMSHLLHDSLLRARMGRAGYQRAKSLFNRPRMLELTLRDRISIIEK